MTILQVLLAIVAVVAFGLLLGRLLMKLAIGDKITDPNLQQQAEIAAASAPQVLPITGEPPPATPFELRLPAAVWWSSAQWALGFAFAALCLFGDPSLLWTRWLAYPAGVLSLMLALFNAWGAGSEWRRRLVVSPTGLELRHGARVDASLRWDQVARVTLTEQWGSRWRSGSSFSSETYLMKRQLVFGDAQGNPLLELPEPLRPAEAYRCLLNAVPTWTGGVRVMREIRRP